MSSTTQSSTGLIDSTLGLPPDMLARIPVVGAIAGVAGVGVMGLLYLIALILTIVGTVKMAGIPNVGNMGGIVALTVLSWLFMATPGVNIVLPSVLVHMVRTRA